MGRNRSGVLELAVLGLLNGTPMHGYELRKRLYTVLGAFRALSYGSLYPCLHELQAAGLITEDEPEPPAPAGTARARAGRRSLKVYRLTADGKERLQNSSARGVRRRGRTTGSVFTSRFSGRPGPTLGSGSSRAAAAGSRSGRRPSGRRSRAPGSAWTATPWNCTGMAWNQWSGKSDG